MFEKIRARLIEKDISFFANDNVSACIKPGELKDLEKEVAYRVR